MDELRRIESLLSARVPLGTSAQASSALPGDLRLSGDEDGGPARTELRSAAVLIPIIDRAEGMTLLFTRRTGHLKSHAGQISLPGGAREPEDKDSVETALRELYEETGIHQQHVTVLGRLRPYKTVTDFRVVPVTAVVHPDFRLEIDENEVESVFEAPLSFVLDPANLVKERRMFQGRMRSYYAIPYGEQYIWGATAAILVNLAATLRDYASVNARKGAAK